jgi:hypothetical protein
MTRILYKCDGCNARVPYDEMLSRWDGRYYRMLCIDCVDDLARGEERDHDPEPEREDEE